MECVFQVLRTRQIGRRVHHLQSITTNMAGPLDRKGKARHRNGKIGAAPDQTFISRRNKFCGYEGSRRIDATAVHDCGALSLKPLNRVLNNDARGGEVIRQITRSEEHTSELQSLMRISYAVFCL